MSGIVAAQHRCKIIFDDELNRRIDEYYPNVATPYLTLSKVHTDYDANNNVTNIIETKATTTNSTITDTTANVYDDFDRLTSSTQRGMNIIYNYDANGNRTLVSSPTGSTSYTYDSRNRLASAFDGASTTGFTYYADGKKNTVTYPNGTDVKYTYYATNRINTVLNEVTSGGAIISSYTYAYDKNGNRTSQTEVQDGTTETTVYTYDSIDRLKTFTVSGSGNTTITEYTFEGYNRKTEKITLNGAITASKTYSYDETDWLVRVEDSVANRIINYAYDRNGNTMVKTDSLSPSQNRSFVYDSMNRLVRSTDTSNNVLGLYDYNSAGLRIRHINSDRGDVTYFYDGRSVIDEYGTGGTFLAHYRYADRLLNLTTLSGIQYYHHDGLGSTVNLTDTLGTTQVGYRLDPWGHIRSQSGYSINRHIFTDKEHDLNTGLVYFGARYYDADTARFITQDTYLGEPGTPPSLHRYLYAYSNPTMYVDLMGYAAMATGEYLPLYFNTGSEGYDYRTRNDFSFTQRFSEATGLSQDIKFGQGGSRSEALGGLEEAFASFNITAENAQMRAVLLVEEGDTQSSLEKFVLTQMGTAFQKEFASNENLQGSIRGRLQGATQGDLINLSDAWSFAVVSAEERAERNSNIYAMHRAGADPVPFVSSVVSEFARNWQGVLDNEAPPAMRHAHIVDLSVDIAGLLPMPELEGLNAVKEALSAGKAGIAATAKDLLRGLWSGEIGGRLNPFNYSVEGLGSNVGNIKYRLKNSALTAEGRPTGRDWVEYFRQTYGRENVEWSSLEQLRKQWRNSKQKIVRAWEDSHGESWPTTDDGRLYVPHHDPALSEGGSIWDIRPEHPDLHSKMHGGGKTAKPKYPFDPFNRE